MQQITIDVNEGHLIIYPSGKARPAGAEKLIDPVPPEVVALIEAGKQLVWVPDDPSDIMGSGHCEEFVPDLDDVKQEQKGKIADARWAQEFGGFLLPPEQGGMFVRTDQRTRTLLTNAKLKADADPTYTVYHWKTAEGTFITLNAPTIQLLEGAVDTFINALFAKEETLSGLVDSATTVEEVYAISW